LKIPNKGRPAIWAALGVSVFVLLTARPAAGKRQGIAVTVNQTDGSRIRGELIAVRAGSLVIQDEEGPFVFIDVADIKFIEKAKKSALLGATNGFIRFGFIGLIVGDLAAGSKAATPERRTRAILGCLAGGLFGAVTGGLKGVLTKEIETIEIQRYPPEKIGSAMERLSREARIRGLS